MLYVIAWNEKTDKTKACTFNSFSEYLEETFSPDLETICIIDTQKPPGGKTYNEKKETLQRQAIHAQFIDNIAWLDIALLQDYFIRYGKRYGLLKEFRDNSII